MSLLFASNLNHVLKKIKFIFNFKNKIKIKFFHVAERYHLPTVICLRWCASCSSKTICYVKKKQLLFYKERFISIQNIKCKENEWTKFEKEKKMRKFGLDSYYQKRS